MGSCQNQAAPAKVKGLGGLTLATKSMSTQLSGECKTLHSKEPPEGCPTLPQVRTSSLAGQAQAHFLLSSRFTWLCTGFRPPLWLTSRGPESQHGRLQIGSRFLALFKVADIG